MCIVWVEQPEPDVRDRQFYFWPQTKPISFVHWKRNASGKFGIHCSFKIQFLFISSGIFLLRAELRSATIKNIWKESKRGTFLQREHWRKRHLNCNANSKHWSPTKRNWMIKHAKVSQTEQIFIFSRTPAMECIQLRTWAIRWRVIFHNSNTKWAII